MRDESGQSVVEFALIVPTLLIVILFGVLELATLLSDSMTLSSAAREGARIGGAMVNGGGPLGCAAGQSPNAATVDPNIVAAVERILEGSGTRITPADVSQIRIWKSTAAGAETAGAVNVWIYSPGAGPVVDGRALDFVPQSQPWQVCSRTNVPPVDSVGITVRYTYRGRTPIAFLFSYFTQLPITERTVMAMNVTK